MNASDIRMARRRERLRQLTSSEVGSWISASHAPTPISTHRHLFASGRAVPEQESFGFSKVLIRPITAQERSSWKKERPAVQWVDASSTVLLSETPEEQRFGMNNRPSTSMAALKVGSEVGESPVRRPSTALAEAGPVRERARWEAPPGKAEEPPTVRRLKAESIARMHHCLVLPRCRDLDDPVSRGSFPKSGAYDLKLAQLKKTRTGAWAVAPSLMGGHDVATGTLASTTNAAVRARDWALKLRKPVERRPPPVKRRSSSSSDTGYVPALPKPAAVGLAAPVGA